MLEKERIDEVLGPVAEVCRDAADELLDLRAAVLGRSDPGNCVSCYFRIFEVLGRGDVERLKQLRRWLEGNLVVVARDGSERELERIPVSLHQEDMESFCREMMLEFRENRCYADERIELSLDFNELEMVRVE